MIITERLNDDDKKVLIDLLKDKRMMNLYNICIIANYTLAPICVSLCIITYLLHFQCLLFISVILTIYELLYIMIHLKWGEKYHKIVNMSGFIERMDKIKEITIEEVKLDDKKICNTRELKRVIKFSNFVLLVTNKRKFLIFKINEDDMKELQSIIIRLNIPFKVEKKKFFIYKYLF